MTGCCQATSFTCRTVEKTPDPICPNGAMTGGVTDRWSAHDGDNVWADFDGEGDLLTRYLNGRAMDQRFARFDELTDTAAFYLTDNINSVRQIVEGDGTVLYSASYTAFGMTASQSGSGGDRFKFTGRELDATGQYFYRARYYGAGVGRFASEDPIGFAAGDANLYRYVENEPIDSNDPSGLQHAGPGDAPGWVWKWLKGEKPPPSSQAPKPPPDGPGLIWIAERPMDEPWNRPLWWTSMYVPHEFVVFKGCDGKYYTYSFDGAWNESQPIDKQYIGPWWQVTTKQRVSGSAVASALVKRKGDSWTFSYMCCEGSRQFMKDAGGNPDDKWWMGQTDWNGEPLDWFGKPQGRWYPSIKYQ